MFYGLLAFWGSILTIMELRQKGHQKDALSYTADKSMGL